MLMLLIKEKMLNQFGPSTSPIVQTSPVPGMTACSSKRPAALIRVANLMMVMIQRMTIMTYTNETDQNGVAKNGQSGTHWKKVGII